MLIKQDENFLTTFHCFLPTFSQFSYYFAVLIKGKVYNLAVYLRRKVYASKEFLKDIITLLFDGPTFGPTFI